MPLEARLLIGLAVALAVAYAATPVAIRVADHFAFYDKPAGYKGHARPTPYLGGAAVLAGFVVAVLLLTADLGRSAPLLGGVVVLWVVGTIDDRRTVPPGTRVLVEVVLACILWIAGLGWDLGLGGAVDLGVTVIWVVAVVNAFNLFDNMDGQASTMALVVAGGVALLGLVQGDVWLAVVSAALCGACIGFLPHNLASPARIFLGDGGSMPIGFAVAAVVMSAATGAAAEVQALALGLLLIGVPALDTTLVVISRTRRGIPLLTGGRDHLTHRTRRRMRTARAVAVTLGGAQAVVSSLAVVAAGGGPLLLGGVVVYLAAALAAIALLDSDAVREEFGEADAAARETAGARPSARRNRPWAVSLPAGGLGVLAGLSPFFSGFYDATVWIPGGLALVALLAAGILATAPRFSATEVAALLAAGAIAAWTAASAIWADSVAQAVEEGNRWFVYAAALALALVAMRPPGAWRWALGGLTAGSLAVGVAVLAALLGPDPRDGFLAGRLDAPLGYINGQGSALLLGAWASMAFAVGSAAPWVRGAALGSATLLASLALLTQSRGVALAAAASTLVVLVLVPARRRTAWALVVLGGSIVVASPALLAVYDSGAGPVPRDARTAALAAAAVSLLAGGTWWAGCGAVRRVPALRTAATAVLAGAAAVAVVAVAASAGPIAEGIERRYDAFTAVGSPSPSTAPAPAPSADASRLASGAGNRFDYWRVAWNAWQTRPVLGVGAGGYDVPYFADRATGEDVRQPHSLALQALTETGLVGFALLFGLVAVLAAGALRTNVRAGREPTLTGAAAGATGITVAWLVHASVDWEHLIPGLTLAALIAAAVVLREAGTPPGRRQPRARLAGAVTASLVLAVGAMSLARSAFTEYEREQARMALAAGDPRSALDHSDRALRLDPAEVTAYHLKAAALARFGEGGAAEAVLRQATAREPTDFVTWALLGDLLVRRERLEQAAAAYRRASALNPRDAELAALAREPSSATKGLDGTAGG